MNKKDVRKDTEPTHPLPGEPSETPLPLTDEQQENVSEEQQSGTREPPASVEQQEEKQAPKLSRLEKLEQKKAQIEAQIKALHARESEKERKVRTRRLVQIGALSEKYFKCEGMEPGEFEELLKKIVAMPEVKTILKRS